MQDFPLQLLFSLLALAMVLALAWLLIRGLRSIQRSARGNRDLAVKSTLMLGARERLVVVEYRGQDYLVGVSAGGVSLLDKQAALEAGAGAPGVAGIPGMSGSAGSRYT